DVIDQAMACQDEEEAAEVARAGKSPPRPAQGAEHIGPRRQDDVGGIQLGTERGREMPLEHALQVGLEREEDLTEGVPVTFAHPCRQVIKGIVHDPYRAGEPHGVIRARRPRWRRRGVLESRDLTMASRAAAQSAPRQPRAARGVATDRSFSGWSAA